MRACEIKNRRNQVREAAADPDFEPHEAGRGRSGASPQNETEMWADARGGAPPHCLLGNMSSTRPRRLAAHGARTPTRQKESKKKEKSSKKRKRDARLQRDLIQKQVQQLEQSLCVTQTDLELLSSETDEDSDDEDSDRDTQSAAALLAQRDKVQKEIQDLETVLGPHSPASVSDADSSSSSDGSELVLASTVESCLQINLVYQQVVQEALDKLEILLSQNEKQQKEAESQLSGPIKEPHREAGPTSSYQLPANMFLGRFLKPYFKDKLTGLGPPANQESRDKSSRMTGCLGNRKVKVKRWESWQKTLLIHSVSRDSLRRLIQPKLSKVDYLSQKLLSAAEGAKQQLQDQITNLETEIEILREKKEKDLIGDRYVELDWQKISNVDFEGTRDADDLRCFWQNFLHPSINKSGWSQEEVHALKQLSRKYQERQWESIAEELGTGRTAFMCLQTFQRFASDSLKRCTWTPAEDALLKELVEKMRIGNFIPYTQMSYFMESREPAQLIYRWNNVLDPSLRKGPWTPEEDQLLLRAVSRYGEKDWWKIRMEVPGRHDGACRDRYFDCLKADTKRGPFDKLETELLQKLVEKHGVGRWAKIAAEIPHRMDAQCLREWRKLSRSSMCPAQKKKVHKSAKRRKWRKRAGAQKKLDEEVEQQIREEEEEETIVEYMDSDEEVKKRKKNQMEQMEQPSLVGVEEEEEVMYSSTPMQEWIPAEQPPASTELRFRPTEFPSSRRAQVTEQERTTVLGQYGRSVVMAAPPEEQPLHRCFSSSALMVTSGQLQAHLAQQANRFQAAAARRRTEYELRAAVAPWVGNLVIPSRSRRSTADQLREQAQRRALSSTPIFLLLLQTMNVDSVGCMDMIRRREREAAIPPAPGGSSCRKDPKHRTGLMQRRMLKQQLQDLHQRLDLEQVQQRQKLVLQPLPPPAPSLPEQPGALLQVPPQRNPVLLPPPVFIPQPSAASFQLLRPVSFMPLPPSPKVVVAFPLAAPPGLVAPPPLLRLPPPPVSFRPGQVRPSAGASAGPHVHTGISSCVFPPSAPAPGSTHTCLLPTSTSTLNSPPPFYDHDYAASAAPPSNGDSGPRKSPEGPTSQGGAEEARSRSGWEGRPHPGGSVGAVGGKRLRKPSQRARAFQEAARAKAEAKRRRSSPPFKKRPDQVLLARRGRRAGQAVWVMTPLVRLEQAPPPGVPLTLVQHPAQVAPPPPPLVFVADPAVAPPLRKKPRFEPSLMFLQPADTVAGWLGGRRGVLVSRGGVALPYLPPFVSSLKTLGLLLRARSSLTKASLQLLRQGLEASRSQSRPLGPSSTNESPAQVPDPPEPPPGSSISSNLQQQEQQQQQEEEEEEEEERLVLAVRQLVAERFSSNPAYQLLRARFLSCFTLPALLASIQPPPERTAPRKTSQQEQEQEEEEEEEEPKPKKTSKRDHLWRAEEASLQLEESGAPASHFSGISTTPPVQRELDLDLDPDPDPPRRAENPDLQAGSR